MFILKLRISVLRISCNCLKYLRVVGKQMASRYTVIFKIMYDLFFLCFFVTLVIPNMK